MGWEICRSRAKLEAVRTGDSLYTGGYPPYVDNPGSVPEAILNIWKKENVMELVGHCNDMTAIYRGAHMVCLPSYREGLSKVLIEAAACERPIVTTDVPGFREVVRNGDNGLLMPALDSKA
jgi:glycosyltransferase involved in cell wall biosynthesis